MRIFTLRQRLIVYGTTLSIIVVMCGLGFWVGGQVGSAKLGVLGGLVISFPITQYLLIKQLRKHLKNTKHYVAD